MNSIEKQLCQRLVKKGIALHEIPGLMRDLVNIMELYPEQTHEEMSQKLVLLGWTNLHMDFFTFLLATVVLESDARSDNVIWESASSQNSSFHLSAGATPA